MVRDFNHEQYIFTHYRKVEENEIMIGKLQYSYTSWLKINVKNTFCYARTQT